MKNHFQKAIGVVCLVASMLCLVLTMMCCHSGINANKNTIHYSDIEKIHIGMPLDSVVLELGQPYAFSSDLGCHDLTCKNPRVVSEIKMTKGTDIVHYVDSIYQDTNYCCEANRENMRNIGKHATLDYTEEPSFLKSIFNSPMFTYPMLWIHLDSNYRVSEVYAKYYGKGWDEKCIYSLSENPAKDSQDNNIELIGDTTLFRKCFPK